MLMMCEMNFAVILSQPRMALVLWVYSEASTSLQPSTRWLHQYAAVFLVQFFLFCIIAVDALIRKAVFPTVLHFQILTVVLVKHNACSKTQIWP